MKFRMLRRNVRRGVRFLGLAAGALVCVAISLPLLVSPATAATKDWPNKVISIIVPWPTGGATDLIARSLAPKLSKTLGVPVQTINKPGGAGIPGTLEAVSATPDGYTLLWDCGGSSSMQYAMSRDLPYKVFDRTFIARATSNPMAIIVPSSKPWKTMDDFVKAIQADPSSISFGMIGGTGVPDVLVYQLKAALKAKGVDVSQTRMVTYKGGGELPPAVAGAHVSAAFISPSEVVALLGAGKLRVLAVTAPTGKRYRGWPDVPTFTEVGLPTVDIYFWVGLSGTPALPEDVIKAMDHAVKEAVKEADQDPAVVATFDKLGITAFYMPSEDYKKFVRDEGERVKALVGN